MAPYSYHHIITSSSSNHRQEEEDYDNPGCPSVVHNCPPQHHLRPLFSVDKTKTAIQSTRVISTPRHHHRPLFSKQQFSPLELFQPQLFQFCQVAVSVSGGIAAVTHRPWYVCCHYSQANGIYIRSLPCAQL